MAKTGTQHLITFRMWLFRGHCPLHSGSHVSHLTSCNLRQFSSHRHDSAVLGSLDCIRSLECSKTKINENRCIQLVLSWLTFYPLATANKIILYTSTVLPISVFLSQKVNVPFFLVYSSVQLQCDFTVMWLGTRYPNNQHNSQAHAADLDENIKQFWGKVTHTGQDGKPLANIYHVTSGMCEQRTF